LLDDSELPCREISPLLRIEDRLKAHESLRMQDPSALTRGYELITI